MLCPYLQRLLVIFASATKSFSITSINDFVIFSINSGVSCVKSSLNIFIPASESSSKLFIKQFALELYIVLLQNISLILCTLRL